MASKLPSLKECGCCVAWYVLSAEFPGELPYTVLTSGLVPSCYKFRVPDFLKRRTLAGRNTDHDLVQKRFQSHAQSGVVFIVQGDEPKGLQAARGRFACRQQKLGHAVNCTLAGLKCHFHKGTLLESFRQDQHSSGDRECVQLGSNGLATLQTNRHDNRAAQLYATRSLGWIWFGKIRHGCRLCHQSPVSTRLLQGVADCTTPLACIFPLHFVALRQAGSSSNHETVKGVTLQKSSASPRGSKAPESNMPTGSGRYW